MSEDGSGVPSVSNDEWLARFITASSWVRQDQTLRQDAFIPHPRTQDLSVTRHRTLSEQRLWEIGQQIADSRPATLYGRADITAGEVRRNQLNVEALPVEDNLNHAGIVGWPLGKSAQKNLAQKLAAAATYKPKPPAPF